ncbi:MAG: hypothetical protein HKP52_03625 [Desulfofustis sp.]|nr:hypothetical protein [Desulfofustis sp.]MBT8346838.1 hypothetical protein [Desulfofustis sp.]MBT8355714.1 hypothetical protein [Desulfofustis sp.]NNK13306.1 hypothetical protein [Desulfofustis sp.]NNK55854.1 hypothetical protein [Desulfofustis sp.]
MKSAKFPVGLISTLAIEAVTRIIHGCGKISAQSLISSQNSDFTRNLLLILIVLLLSGTAIRAQEDSPPIDQTPTTIDTQNETTSQESSAEEVVWPPPFDPSEEIGADAQISFPTDI